MAINITVILIPWSTETNYWSTHMVLHTVLYPFTATHTEFILLPIFLKDNISFLDGFSWLWESQLVKFDITNITTCRYFYNLLERLFCQFYNTLSSNLSFLCVQSASACWEWTIWDTLTGELWVSASGETQGEPTTFTFSDSQHPYLLLKKKESNTYRKQELNNTSISQLSMFFLQVFFFPPSPDTVLMSAIRRADFMLFSYK